jgi:hypothetical protein
MAAKSPRCGFVVDSKFAIKFNSSHNPICVAVHELKITNQCTIMEQLVVLLASSEGAFDIAAENISVTSAAACDMRHARRSQYLLRCKSERKSMIFQQWQRTAGPLCSS